MPSPQDSPRTPLPVGGRWLAPLVAVALLAAFVGQAVYYLGLSLPQQIREIPDDSFFYLQVARSFCDGNGFSFDGEQETYGFQPLWQLISIVATAVLGDGQRLFQGMFLLCAALHALTAWALFRFGSRNFGSPAGIAMAALWLGNVQLFSWSCGLKENVFYAWLLVVALDRFVRDLRTGTSTRGSVLFGVILGLMVFNRVNALLPAMALLAMHVVAFRFGGGIRMRLRHVVLAALVALLVAGPWYVFAKFYFGTAMPTSGTWKLQLMRGQVEVGWGTPWMSIDHVLAAIQRWPNYIAMLFRSGFGVLCAPLYVAAVVWPLATLWRRVTARRVPVVPAGSGPVLLSLVALAGSAAATSLANQMMLPGYLDYATWYAVPEYLLFAIVGGALVGTCWRRGDGWIGAGVLVVLLGVALWLWPPRFHSSRGDEREAFTRMPQKTQLAEIGMWVRDHVPADQRIGIWDPGIVAWFADRRLISFDPLMNSLEYQQGDIANPVGYVNKRKIAYMIGVADRVEGKWRYIPLPPGGYEIVWMPYPDRGVGFGTTKDDQLVVVRPLASPVEDFLDDDDFPCGVLYPNDPKRRRDVTRDRDRLLGGEAVAADVVRLWLDVPQGGKALELRAGDATVARFPAGSKGFHGVDVREYRGQSLSVVYPGGTATEALRQAHLVDFTW